jgi:hypothetical protein
MTITRLSTESERPTGYPSSTRKRRISVQLRDKKLRAVAIHLAHRKLRFMIADHPVSKPPPLDKPVFVTRPTYGVNHEDFQDLDDEYYSDEEDFDIEQGLETLEGGHGMSMINMSGAC